MSALSLQVLFFFKSRGQLTGFSCFFIFTFLHSREEERKEHKLETAVKAHMDCTLNSM